MPVFFSAHRPSFLKSTSSIPSFQGLEGPELPIRMPEIGRMTPEKGQESLEHVCKPAQFRNFLEAGSESAHCRASEPLLVHDEAGHARAKTRGGSQPFCSGGRPRGRALCPCPQLLPDRDCRSSASPPSCLAKPAERLRRTAYLGARTAAGRCASSAACAAPGSNRPACSAHIALFARGLGKRVFAPRLGAGFDSASIAPGPCA
jgi:hypothetical protein